MTDVITCSPRDVYYPFWVKQMNDNRHLFGRVIVVMTQGGDRDYTHYLEDHLKNVSLITKYPQTGDWRHQATITALKYVLGDKVLFLEQDFLAEPDFYEKLNKADDEVIGFWTGNRLHPACLRVNKSLIDNPDFSVDPDVGDHFYKFTKGLMEHANVTILEALGLCFYHLAGLTQNYRLTDNFYQPNQFLTYNQKCLDLDMPDEWRTLINSILDKNDFVIDKEVSSYFDKCLH